MAEDKKRVARWYFGGLAGAMSTVIVHPLDLMKVQLQTQQGKSSLSRLAKHIYSTAGVSGFYSGISASILRQMTYSTTRFGIYETVKNECGGEKNLSFVQKAALAGVSGASGGLVGAPADMVNVRMQNDSKLPQEQRRNYKNALDGIYRVVRNEGPFTLFNGASMAVARATVMTIGQLSFYDQIKQTLIAWNLAKDTPLTHVFSSFCAASIATMMTQPLDVMKTRLQNAPKGQFKGIVDCFVYTAKMGPSGFFKGFIPAWVRLAPMTVLMFVCFEQLRINFGTIKKEEK